MAEIGTDIQYAADLIKEGKLVAIPTDTVYGLAGDALNPIAVKEIYRVKKRALSMPILTMIASINSITNLSSNLPQQLKSLVEKYWPGALTLILPALPSLPSILLSGGDTVGVRVPDHQMTLSLLSIVNTPLAVTSANISGKESSVSALEVNHQIGNKIDYILDGGICQLATASTIIGLKKEQLNIIREGAIPTAEVMGIFTSA